MLRETPGWASLVRDLDAAARDGLPRDQVDHCFDLLLDAYLGLSEDQRGPLRAAYVACRHWGTHEYWMNNISYFPRLRASGDAADVRRMLAHYSMSDGYPDQRDAVLGVSALCEAAAGLGIDVDPILREIGAATSLEDRGIGPYNEYFGLRSG